MVGRFRHLTVALTAAALMAGPNALPAADTAANIVDGPTTARIGLTGADPDGLQRFAAAVSDPHSAQYRHFLTPDEVRAKFGPTAAQLTKVHDWLAGAELTVTEENSHWIDVAGTSAKIRQAFGSLPHPRSNAAADLAERAAAEVPPALAGMVSSVAGLVPETYGVRQFSYRVAAGPRRQTVSGDGVNPGGPMQPAAPGMPKAKVDPGGPVPPTAPTVPNSQINPGGPMRPSGPVASSGPVGPVGPMHSSDEGVDPAVIDQENKIFTTGAAEGIGFAFATGDCGDQAPGLDDPGCDPGSARAQAEWPAASPWVTAVGGTTLALGPTTA